MIIPQEKTIGSLLSFSALLSSYKLLLLLDFQTKPILRPMIDFGVNKRRPYEAKIPP
jgi:hypothetical protein